MVDFQLDIKLCDSCLPLSCCWLRERRSKWWLHCFLSCRFFVRLCVLYISSQQLEARVLKDQFFFLSKQIHLAVSRNSSDIILRHEQSFPLHFLFPFSFPLWNHFAGRIVVQIRLEREIGIWVYWTCNSRRFMIGGKITDDPTVTERILLNCTYT